MLISGAEALVYLPKKNSENTLSFHGKALPWEPQQLQAAHPSEGSTERKKPSEFH